MSKSMKNHNKNFKGSNSYTKKDREPKRDSRDRFKAITVRKTVDIKDLVTDREEKTIFMAEVLEDLFTLNPDIKNFFEYKEIEMALEDLTADDCKNIMINQFTRNVPEMKIDGENGFWSIQVSSNRCVLKTDRGYQFGWTLKISRDRTAYESIELMYTAFSPNAATVIDDMIDFCGWKKDTY